jgi:hypothetical protein
MILSHGFQHGRLFHPWTAFRKSSGLALLEKMFSRFMEGRAPTDFTLRENGVYRAGACRKISIARPMNVSL